MKTKPDGHNKTMVVGKRCPKCGGKYNLKTLPRYPEMVKCGWCNWEGFYDALLKG